MAYPSFGAFVAVLLASLDVALCQFDRSLYLSSPPVYPSPNATGEGWEAAYAQAQTFLARLSLESKAAIVTGDAGPCVGNIAPNYTLGFNGICLQDGPLAIRQADYASVFPAGVTVASSWDRELMRQRGVYLGQEFRGKGANVHLGPAIGPLGRTPWSGRNWEGFSSDPYLSGVAVEETITGVQSVGVQACAKHWLANEQETQRTSSFGLFGDVSTDAVSSNVDDRTLHELYAWPFYNAVHAGVVSVMCAYNRLNQSYACQNSKLLNGILKDEMGFQGYVMSDWGATHSGVAGIEAGADLDMPGQPLPVMSPKAYWGDNIVEAVQNGSLSEARLDDMILRILTPYYYFDQDSPDYPSVDPSSADRNTIFNLVFGRGDFNLTGPRSRDVRANHATLIRELGAAGTVLLKNVNNALPLNRPNNIGVFGNGQGEPVADWLGQEIGTSNWPTGTLVVGGGSGSGDLSRLVAPLTAIRERAEQDGSRVDSVVSNAITQFYVAIRAIQPIPDVCLVFLKQWAAEGEDLDTLNVDWSGNSLVESVASYCNNTVVVVHNPGPVNLPFSNNPNVTAILLAHYPGEETGHSLVDVLYGDVNPSGRLPYTIAETEADYGAEITRSAEANGGWQSDFTEGLLIDYRYFDSSPSTNNTVLYPFGYGLSYTTFSIGNLSIADLGDSSSDIGAPYTTSQLNDLFSPHTVISATVKNTGNVRGAAVPQLYLSLPTPPAGPAGSPNADPANNPKRVLRGFDKVQLDVGETAEVRFELMRRDVSYWDVWTQSWEIQEGEVGVEVGWHVGDVQASGAFNVS